LLISNSMDKPKFRLLKDPSECDLLRTHPDVTMAEMQQLWSKFCNLLPLYDALDLSYYSWFTTSLTLQPSFPPLVIKIGLKTEVFDAIGDIIYSNLSDKFRERFQDSIESFVESLIYPHREGATLKRYREILAWMEKIPGSSSFAAIQKSFLSTEALVSRLSEDYSARLSVDGYLKKFHPVSLAETRERLIQNSPRYDETNDLFFQAKFQCFVFAAAPITAETIYIFLESIQVNCGV
jgi:hypothetical protein